MYFSINNKERCELGNSFAEKKAPMDSEVQIPNNRAPPQASLFS